MISIIICIFEVYRKIMKQHNHRYRKLFIMLAGMLILQFSFKAIAQQKGEEPEVYEDWRLKKDTEGIRIYTRWIEAEEGRKARQMHAIMEVPASLNAAVMALTDEDQVGKWLNRAKEYYHFDAKDSHHWYAYTQFKIPWPLDNQDLVTYNTLEQDKETRIVKVQLDGRPEYIPDESGVQRIPHFDGTWIFTPKADGIVQIEYFIFTKTKPIMPRWVIDPIVEHGLWSTFYDMQRIILENETSDMKLTFIAE